MNVLLVVVDTLGAEYVGCLAPAPDGPSPTPNLDRLAAGGLLFRRAFSPAPWTQPAVASLVTGRMPYQHGLVHLFDALDEGEVTLAELLHERGFATGAVVSHLLLEPRYGFGQGFDDFDVSQAGGGHGAVTSEAVTDTALRWLDARAAGSGQAGGDRRPFFLLVHYFDPHYVYRHHPGFDRTAGYAGPLEPGMDIWKVRDARPRLTPADVAYLAGLYREEVAYTDHHLGRLLRGLARGGADRKTLVLVAADHGEEFMRHGWIGHTRTLYDELLHVPLIVSLPGVIAPREVAGPVSLLDLVPTLMALSTRPPPEPSPWAGSGGVSLAPLLTGAPEELAGRDLFAEVSFVPGPDDPRRLEQKAAYKTALLATDWKLVHDLTEGRWHLFDRRADPEELHDLAATGDGAASSSSAPAISVRAAEAELRRRLAAWEARRADSAAARRPGALTPTDEDLAHLRALGYLR